MSCARVCPYKSASCLYRSQYVTASHFRQPDPQIDPQRARDFDDRRSRCGHLRGCDNEHHHSVCSSSLPSSEHQLEFREGLGGEGRKTNQSMYLSPGYITHTSASPADLKVLKLSESGCGRLGDICEKLIFGVVISGNKSGLVSDVPKRGWKPFLEGCEIQRYFIRPTVKYLHYVPSEIHRARTPKIFDALRSC
jgi:hypothetical protein